MEKYLVIILLILLMYTVYQCWKLATVTTEGFADASVPTNVDTNNSIATLAQLAKDLQAGGGLKVPGNMTLGGTFQSGLLVDSSTGSGIGLYHPKNGYMLFSVGATTGDGTKTGWNQVNIRGDDIQFRNANGGDTTVTTNGNLNVTGSLNLLPRGIITAWFGATVPAGWTLCNGTNGTPNLVDRFILGSADKYNETGGASSYKLTSEQIPLQNYGGIASAAGGSYGVFGAPSTNNTTYSVVPPYFRLAYIMKL